MERMKMRPEPVGEIKGVQYVYTDLYRCVNCGQVTTSERGVRTLVAAPEYVPAFSATEGTDK